MKVQFMWYGNMVNKFYTTVSKAVLSPTHSREPMAIGIKMILVIFIATKL